MAVNDGRIVGIGRTPRLGRFIRLRDAFGNTFTYGHVRADARTRPRPRASDGGPFGSVLRPLPALVEATHRLELARIRPGARVTAGTILGRIGKTSETVAPHLLFEIRPAGTGAPRIDPKPILDGWKLLETTAAYGVVGRNPLTEQPSIGRILLMSKPALIKRVLANPRIDIYGCGRRDVRLRIVDRRVLATLEFLAASGFKPTVTSLRCGHSYYAKGGSVSHHSSGNAVDIAKINGIPVLGHQGPGSIAELAAQRLLTLQGLMKPDQIITLMSFEGADNAFAMADHADHIHVGWRPLDGTDSEAAKQVNASLQPKQWIKLVDRLVALKNPTLADAPNSPRRPR